jgi:short-subunit dehydrogenase
MSHVVLITGASSGIGRALAIEYARRGADLALLARRADRLAAVARETAAHGRRTLTLTCDVTDDAAVDSGVETALREFGRLDVVIANAGFGVSGRFERLSLDDYRRQFETNVFGVLRTVSASIGALRQSRGRLAIVGSVAGYVAAPGMSPYAMSKFAVRALADAIRAELHRDGISVTLISPGFVDSEIRRIDRNGVFRADAPEPVPSWLRVQTDVAARKIVRAIERRRAEAVITVHGKLMVQLARHAPGPMRMLTRMLTSRVRKV